MNNFSPGLDAAFDGKTALGLLPAFGENPDQRGIGLAILGHGRDRDFQNCRAIGLENDPANPVMPGLGGQTNRELKATGGFCEGKRGGQMTAVLAQVFKQEIVEKGKQQNQNDGGKINAT